MATGKIAPMLQKQVPNYWKTQVHEDTCKHSNEGLHYVKRCRLNIL